MLGHPKNAKHNIIILSKYFDIALIAIIDIDILQVGVQL